MTEEQYLIILTEIGKIKDRIQILEIQMALMEPTEIIKFKAKVLEVLKTINIDINKCETGISKYTEDLSKLQEKVTGNETKIKVYAALIGGVVAVASQVLLKVFFG